MPSEAPQRAEPPAFLVKEANPVLSPVESAPATQPVAHHHEEPRHEEPRRAEPRIDPKPILEDAGLVMVETDRSKAKVMPQAEEPVNLGRPRRERPAAPAPESDSLVQIETKR
jgi:hypothetical protein